MADRLTQLQDALDQLLTQMYACIRYVDTHHSFAPISGQPNFPLEKPDREPRDGAGATANATVPSGEEAQQAHGLGQDPDKLVVDPPELFQARLRELASDLVHKEQQIEALISMLPGVGSSSAAQAARMQSLNEELKALEVEKLQAAKERDRLLRMVDEVVLRVRRP